MEQREWLVQIVVRASEAEVEQITDRVGQVICVPPDHDGSCRTPWTLTRTALDDLDGPERLQKGALLADE